MHIRFSLAGAAAAAAFALPSSPVPAAPARPAASAAATMWNDVGHMTVATIAYEQLSPRVRTRVDSLLRRHPDYEVMTRGLAPGGSDFGMRVFMRASTWPDFIKGDPRFYNEARAQSQPTRRLPGFPDMMQHRDWHYLDQPYSADGTPPREPETPNALTQIVACARALGDPGVHEVTQSYGLSWLLHLVGDVHQPLHAISRFSRQHTRGDAGGNAVRLQSGPAPGDTTNLHSFWDGILGRDRNPDPVVALARRIVAEHPPVASSETAVRGDSTLEGTVKDWIDESATLSRYVVYTVGPEGESERVGVTPEYRALAESVARHRVALAGYRMANLIEARLR